MKQSKKIAELKQHAIEITNKQQLNQVKGGNIVVDVDYRERVVGTADYRAKTEEQDTNKP